MKKGQVLEGKVERVDFPNKGIVETGEGAVIVKNSLPGQIVKLSVNKVRNGKAEGRLLEVLEKSPLETGLPCSHFGVCGGCTYLSLPYEEQLHIKAEQVKRLLDHALKRQEREWTWEGIKGSPVAYEYRNKMEFSFGDEVKDNYRSQLKSQNISDINNHEYTYAVGTIYMDIINECEKLSDYVVNVVEARMGTRQHLA